MEGKLVEQSAIITGGNQGLGLAIAKAFIQEGANICICALDKQQLAVAVDELKTLKISDKQQIISLAIDVSIPAEVEALIQQAITNFKQVHILVNNAGIYGPMGPIDTVDWEQWKKTIEINLYGSVLPCRMLLPHFRQHKYGKIIQISGGGATNPMPRIEAYAASKSAVVRTMESIAQECIADNITVNCVAPGLLNTRLLDEVLANGPERAGEQFYQQMLKAKETNKTMSFDFATALCIFLASKASDGITGRLISAVWDNYYAWPEHIEELQQSDLYTLRRITGRERGITWGDK